MAIKSSKPSESAQKAAPKNPLATVQPDKLVKSIKPKATKVESAPATAPKKRAVKATISKTTASISLDPKPTLVGPEIHHDAASLRAYFIAERRHKMGWPGDSATDWSDAVSQLRAEALEKPLKKR